MSDDLDLSALQSLLAEIAMGTVGLRLYGADHPRAREAVEKGCRTVAALVGKVSGGTLSFLELDGQLLVEGQPVNHVGPQAATLMRTMRRAGIERITLTRGIHQDELQALLGFLADPGGELPASPHVAVGGVSLMGGEAGGGEEALSGRPEARVRDRVALVGESLEALVGGREEGVALAEDVVREIDRLVEDGLHPLQAMASLGETATWPAVHSYNVALVAVSLASLLGLPRTQRLDLGLAGLLHDIGRVGGEAEQEWIADLDRTGDDLEGDPQHPLRGLERTLAIAGLPRLVPAVALEHHLDVKGAGWPNLARPHPPHPAAQLVAASECLDLLHTVRGPRDQATRESVAAWCLSRGGVPLDPFLARLIAVLEQTGPLD